MDFPLTTQHFLWRMRRVHPNSTVASVQDDSGRCVTYTFAEIADRAHALASSLTRLGVGLGDRVGTFAWNSSEHMEIYLAVMSMGAVLHTANPRLHDDQLVWTIEHAEDRVLIVDHSLLPQITPLLPRLPGIEHVIVIGSPPGDAAAQPHSSYETLISGGDSEFEFPVLDEMSAAALCYTSGTTGDPKGVLYSHRSIALHALIMSGAEVFAVSKADVVLATVPMFHVMGWGLPFISVLSGADLVMPGKQVSAPHLLRVIKEHGITWSSGVPTIWMDVLRYIDTHPDAAIEDLSSLRKLILGGSQVPGELIRRFADEADAEVISGWGMTEIFPGAAVANSDPALSTEQNRLLQARAGRVSPFYEVRLTDDSGTVVPHDGSSRGEIEIRGPVVAASYYRQNDSSAKFHDGWLRTGDVATIDSEGWITIVDRSKDMIKSGGEWISSADLEAALLEHPRVAEAAVVGREDERWGERPHAFLVLTQSVGDDEFRRFLADKVAKWWIPDRFDVVSELPRTTTGKYDKKALRRQLGAQNPAHSLSSANGTAR
ncbi:long-chain fatty acid--CoA ligase [Nocardia salmonicida]|uniref:long-chain fatty acid--CoA ligase n=1 Tax=Nocardia salmonicida TaxID=53431 RepID=UPI0033EAC561